MNQGILCRNVAEMAVERHVSLHSLASYSGIVTLQGLVQLAMATGDDRLKRRSLELLTPFVTGKVDHVVGAYDRMYRCGGNAAAWLVKAGFAPEALEMLVRYAEELMEKHPRNENRIFGSPGAPERIWIDSVFAVCPFLTILGNLTGREEFSNEACRQMIGMHELLLNHRNGLYHQSLNFAGPGKLTEDHWSRGNGWAALALADLAVELPAVYGQTAAIQQLFQAHMEACVEFQSDAGLWHQEMTASDSYIETSGSGLILYAIGRGLEHGLLPATYREILLKGLRGYLSYIALDGSVFHTCQPCLCPGDGSLDAYKSHEWIFNDCHAFGPVALAFAQALRLDIETVSL